MAYSICRIKNISSTTTTLYEYEFDPGEIFVIEDSKRDGWATDNNVLVAIASGTFQILDDSGVVGEISDQIDYLRDYLLTKVSIQGIGNGVTLTQQDVAMPDRSGLNVYHKGYEFVADPAAPDGITEHEASYTTWVKLQGIAFRVSNAAYEGDDSNEGDYIEVELVDVNGITGYPAGTVLGKFAETVPIWPGREFIRICEDAKDLPPTIVIRVRYVARGTDKVRVKIEHILRTISG